MKYFIGYMVLLFSSFYARAQEPGILWSHTATRFGDDNAASIIQLKPHTYLVFGYTNYGLFGECDYRLVYLDSGYVLWDKCYGGSGFEYGFSVTQDYNKNGYCLAGYTGSKDGQISYNHGNTDYWIVKVDDTGKIEWEKTLGGTGVDQARCVRATKDGGFIIAGNTRSKDGDVEGHKGFTDTWIVKLSGSGNIEWKKCYGGAQEEIPFSIINATNGGYVIAGTTTSSDGDVNENKGKEDVWIVRLDDTGAITWQKTYGGSKRDFGLSIAETQAGDIIFVGYTDSDDGDVTNHKDTSDAWIVKLNSTGAIIWERDLGGIKRDVARSVAITDDGCIVAGSTKSSDGDVSENKGEEDYWVIKLDHSGAVEWQQTLGGTASDICNAILYDSGGGYTLAGSTSSNNGDVGLQSDKNDFWIVGLSQFPLTANNITKPGSFSIYPTVSNGTVYIKYEFPGKISAELYDLSGKRLRSHTTTNGSITTLSAFDFAPGLHYLKVQDDQKMVATRPVIFVR